MLLLWTEGRDLQLKRILNSVRLSGSASLTPWKLGIAHQDCTVQFQSLKCHPSSRGRTLVRVKFGGPLAPSLWWRDDPLEAILLMLAGSERPAAVDVNLASSQHPLPKAVFFTCSESEPQWTWVRTIYSNSLLCLLSISDSHNTSQALATGTQLLKRCHVRYYLRTCCFKVMSAKLLENSYLFFHLFVPKYREPFIFVKVMHKRI